MVLALGSALSLGGCAVSGSMFSKSSKDDARAYASEDATGLPVETDLVFARMAVVDVLTRGAKQISSPWENPGSGARGTITPIASAYDKDGATCRDFLASYVRPQGPETWMQGQACRAKQGSWEVTSLRPWSRT
jgi:hypothetical protein